MSSVQFLKARVSPEMKTKFRALAEQRQVTESVLLKQLVHAAMRGVPRRDDEVLTQTHRRARGSRLYVRLHPEDHLLLSERAASRQMADATYVSVLVRSHLRSLSPLPKEELKALKQSVAELSAFARNINQLIRVVHQGGKTDAIVPQHFVLMLKVCEGLRDHTKALIKANSRSWETGYEIVST